MTEFRVAAEPVTSPDVVGLLARYADEIASRWAGPPLTGGEHAVEQTLVPPVGAVLVARLTGAGTAVACAGLRRLAPGVGEVKRMYVAPSCRGSGLGRRLLADVEALAVEWGLDRLRLDTRTDLAEALSLYRSSGYQEIPRYNDNPYAAHWLEKRLPNSEKAGQGDRGYYTSP